MEVEGEAWNFFEDILPPEVAEIVFSFLSLEDIVYVSIVCKAWNSYFDTKDIWKKISEHYFGELSSKNVDLTQTFRWRRTFIALSNAHRWAKTFPATSVTYEEFAWRFLVPVGVELGSGGQYIHSRTFSVDVRVAGKIIHTKREPSTRHDRHWFLPSNSDVDEPQCKLLASDGKGKYLFEGLIRRTWNLYDSEEMMTTSPAEHHVIQFCTESRVDVDLHPADLTPNIGSFNSRFAVLADTKRLYVYRKLYHVIFDLQSTCAHVKPIFKDAQKKKYHHESVVKCHDRIIATPFGVLGVFASQLVPEKIVFMLREADQEKSITDYVCYPKLVIWTASEGLNEKDGIDFKHDTDVEAKNFSEHVIDGYHWLCFDMGQHTRIINLNNFANQFKLDLIEKRMWIPNKNKIVLVSGKKLTVLDLHLNRWTSRMTCPNEVRAMTFNKSTRLLFVADTEFVHAFHWETAKLVGSVQHPCAVLTHRQVSTLHIAYDQVIILNGDTFLRMPTKCNV